MIQNLHYCKVREFCKLTDSHMIRCNMHYFYVYNATLLVFLSHSGLLLNGILRSFAPQYIANRCLMFVELIGQCEETAFPKVSFVDKRRKKRLSMIMRY